MALDESNGTNGFVMPVSPLYGGGYGGNNGGFFGGDWAWILLLLLIGGGGWGMGGFGGGMWPAMMMGGMGGFGDFGLYPWMTTNQNVNNGFRDQQIQSSIGALQNSVTSGFGDVSTQLCGGFAGVNQAICQTGNGITAAVTGAQNALAQQLYTNEIGSLNRSFAEQQANAQGFNGLQAQLAQCCCDNRLAAAENKYVLATEACATRTASAEQTRDIIDAQTRGTQAILDKLCALELDGVKGQLAAAQRENLSLQNAVNMATMQASQTAQTAQILAGQAAEIDGVYNRLKNCPVGTYPVCNPLSPAGGCGCNGNLGFAG